jgi:hypothetical protein
LDERNVMRDKGKGWGCGVKKNEEKKKKIFP